MRATVAVATAGLARRAWVGTRPPEWVEFFQFDSRASQPSGTGLILGNLEAVASKPVGVKLRQLEVGHFHGLTYEGDGRIAYLYEATIPGLIPRRGLVKLDGSRIASLT